MSPLSLTVTFLTVMALLTSSEAIRHYDDTIKNAAYKSFFTLNTACEEKLAAASFEELREATAPLKEEGESGGIQEVVKYTGKSAPLNYDHGRPPNNSRFNIYLLMTEAEPQKSPLYEQLATLLRTLYGDQEFMTDSFEYRLLDTLIEYKEEAKRFFFADELGGLMFKDGELHRQFLRMLKGRPPLLHYITLDTHCNGNQKKLNFMFAPAEVLQAAIPDPSAYEKLLAFRNELWQRIDTQEEKRRDLPKDAVKNRSYFKSLLADYINQVDPQLVKQFDLTLGKKGGIIYVKDPVTGIVKRERIMKKKL